MKTIRVGRIFTREWPIVGFPRIPKNVFAGGPKVPKVYFNHSKLRKQPFSYKFDEKMSN